MQGRSHSKRAQRALLHRSHFLRPPPTTQNCLVFEAEATGIFLRAGAHAGTAHQSPQRNVSSWVLTRNHEHWLSQPADPHPPLAPYHYPISVCISHRRLTLLASHWLSFPSYYVLAKATLAWDVSFLYLICFRCANAKTRLLWNQTLNMWAKSCEQNYAIDA